MESVTARDLQEITEKHNLLPEMQMGARRNRSTQTALDLLITQIHTIWEAGGKASLLSLDMSGAFDHVIKRKLVSILRRKGIPRPLVGWIDSFMTNRTTLSFDDKTSHPWEVPAGIPQGSPISPILFLFYNADLVEKCNDRGTRAQAIGFVDDVNILAWSHSTKENWILKGVHEKCMRWVRDHGAKFSPGKYKLLHLSRRHKYHGWRTLKINDTVTLTPKKKVRVLGLELDPKLRWTGHGEMIEEKMITQENALTRLTGSTWGLPLSQGRQVYKMVIRPAAFYAAHVRYNPTNKEKGLLPLLNGLQNRCIKKIYGSYKATPIKSMEVLTTTETLDLYLDSLVASYHQGRSEEMTNLIDAKCAEIRRTLGGGKRTRHRKLEGWMENLDVETKADTRKMLWKEWGTRREARPESRWELRKPQLSTKFLEVHKVESTILTQLQTGKVGLAKFLHWRNLPTVLSPMCNCGQAEETPAQSHLTKILPNSWKSVNEIQSSTSAGKNQQVLVEVEGAEATTHIVIKTPEESEQELIEMEELHIL